jgi:exonuclease SbcC
MKLIRLQLEGFRSYRDRQTIDFNNENLFAIAGETGSGKSTLLDAMLFALFRSTPRAGAKGSAELINPTADEARVELTFEVGGKRWRVTRSASRKSTNLTLLEYEVDGDFRRHASSQSVAQVDKTIEDALGMDFVTFCRAVLLPQGEFDNFLFEDTAADRRRTLMRLYQLEDLVSMKELLNKKNQVRSEQILQLRSEIDALQSTLQGVDPEQLSHQITTGEQERLGLSQQKLVLEKERSTATREHELWQQLHQINRRWQTVQTQAERQQLRQRAIKRHHQAVKLWVQVEAVQQDEQQQLELRGKLALQQQQVDQLIERQLDLRQTYSEQQLLQAQQAAAQLPVLEMKLGQLKFFGGNLAMIHPRPLPFDPERLQQISELERQWEKRQALQKNLVADRQNCGSLDQQVAEVQGRLDELEALLDQLQQQQKDVNVQLEQAHKLLEDANLREGLASHRHSLEPGQPCPLCLQTVDQPPPDPVTNLGELRQSFKILETQARQLDQQYSKSQGERTALRDQLPRLLADRERAEQRLSEVQQQLAEFPPEESLPEQLADERQSRLASLALEIAAVTGGGDWETYQREVKSQLARLEALKQEADQIQARLMGARNELAVSKALDEVNEDNLEKSRKVLLQALNDEQFGSTEEVKAAQLSLTELQALESEEHSFQQERQGVEVQRTHLQNQLLGKQEVTADQIAQLEASYKALAAQLSDLEVKLGIWNNSLEKARETRTRVQRLDGELARAEKEYGEWKQLAEDLQATRFERYLLDRYQQQLLAQASQTLLEFSSGQFQLGLEGGEYKVLDNQQTEPRNVSTLSGGERFMASLALALALSDNLSKGSRQGLLFLDEGFGALSGEALDKVVKILVSLPQNGRTVGIITHVNGLVDRLDFRLRVTKSEDGASTARWEDPQ